MARKVSKTLTDAELRIMDVVWDMPQASIKQVTAKLQKKDPVAYSTVQTMMRILEEKGYLQHTKVSRSFVYSPLVGRSGARSEALRHLLSGFFNDSPQSLVANLVEDKQLDADELKQLWEFIEQSD